MKARKKYLKCSIAIMKSHKISNEGIDGSSIVNRYKFLHLRHQGALFRTGIFPSAEAFEGRNKK